MKAKSISVTSSLLGLSRLIIPGSCLGIFAFAPASWAQTETYNAAGSWTVPANVSAVIIECWGAGGAGGVAVCNGGNTRGGGGAGGSYSRKTLTDLVEGTVYQVIVGSGGVSTTSGATDNTTLIGQTGGDSSFTDASFTTVFAKAAGGVGGFNAVSSGTVANRNGGAGSASGNIGDVTRAGGNGSAGNGSLTGSGGGSAGSNNAGGNAWASVAGLGGLDGGGNGALGVGTRTPGMSGTAPGGGGSGGGENRNTLSHIGGAGGAGKVVLNYSFNSGILNYEVTAVSPQTVNGAEGFNVVVTGRGAEGVIPADSTTVVTMSTPTTGSFLEFDWDGNGTFGDNSGTLINGQRTIKVRNKKAQTVEIVASSTFNTITTPVPLSLETIAGAFTKLQILLPGEMAAPGTNSGKTGTPTSIPVQAEYEATINSVDTFWNLVTSTDTVGLSSSDASATYDASVELFDGTVAYPATFLTPGTQTLTISNLTDSNKASDTSSNIAVNATPVTWEGAVDDQWDTTTSNWTEGTYVNNFAVTFNESGSARPIIDIVNPILTPGPVLPFSVTVDAATTNYTFMSTSGGSIGGNTGLTKSNTGTLTLSTANSYTGATTLNGGQLRLDNASALPPSGGVLILNGGVLGLGAGNFTRALGTAAGQVNMTGNASGFAAYAADRIVNLGGAGNQVSWGIPSGNFLHNGTTIRGTFTLGAADATHTVEFQNPIALTGTRFFSVIKGAASIDARLTGAITGNTTFSKAGNGVLELSNPGNAWTGITFIDSGTLRLGAANVLPSAVVVKKGKNAPNDGVLDLAGFSDTITTLTLGESATDSTTINQTPSVINTGAAATLTLGGGISYAAGLPASLNSQGTISANLATGTTGNRDFTVGDGNATEDLLISGELTGGAITKLGLGTLTLSNPAYSGNTTISSGTLLIRKSGIQTNVNPLNDASTLTVATGAILNLDYSGTEIVAKLIIGATTLTNGTYGANEYPAVISGTGTITVFSDPYLSWAGAGVLFDGDANNDGVENGLAWLLGAANPSANALSLLPEVTQLSGGGLQLNFDMLPSASRNGAKLTLEHSSDLGISDSWVGVLVPDVSGGNAPVTFNVSGTSPLAVSATIAPSEASAGKLFSRLRAEK